MMHRVFPILCQCALLFWTISAAMGQTQDQLSAPEGSLIRFLASDFVLPGKFRALNPLARAEGVRIEAVTLRPGQTNEELLTGADLVVIDSPRRSDRALAEGLLNDQATSTARLIVGGGSPAWQGLDDQDARRLMGWYAAGREENFRQFFRYVAAWAHDAPRDDFPVPVPLPETGIYHPDAPQVFDTVKAYMAWFKARGIVTAGVAGLAIHSGAVSNLQSGIVDTTIRAIEAEGLVPVAFWTKNEALRELAHEAQFDALVIRTHMRGGEKLARTFLDMDIPVIQTIGYRSGTRDDFREAQSGVAAGSAAVFLAGAEVWGVSDPIVLMAVEKGEEVIIPEQLAALTGKLRRLSVLRHTPAKDKRLAMMFWNYPMGEKNLSASNLNIPRSIEEITRRLKDGGYDVTPLAEKEMIDVGQAMLAGIWRSTPLENLLGRDLAGTLPLATYTDWLKSLPDSRRTEIHAGGDPAEHWAVREVAGERVFVIPRVKIGKMVILPQMPRGTSGQGQYHDTSSAPDHLYLAAYLWLRKVFDVDAIVHLGTHGTQEWLRGKDRGLWAFGYPGLAVGDVPVFYPYLQDNVSEAIQAKRRGRAVIVSHQTPPFAPAGLQEDLRNLHQLIHEYAQLSEGQVQDEAARNIRAVVADNRIAADMGWDDARIKDDFSGFMSALHDHLHFLAESAVPLGLHSFGRAADPDHRLVTVMQQLGDSYLSRFTTDGEPFSEDPSLVYDSAPVAELRRWLRKGAPLPETPEDAALYARAASLDKALANPGEVEALLAGLEGRLVAPGSGGDPVRNPDVRAGRNLYAFEADRIPAVSAYEVGRQALDQLIATYGDTNDGAVPEKLAFSLWSSEAIRHLGVTEAQVLHALGLRPVWNKAGRVTALEIISARELGRPRIDVVLSVTSVYRDQFDSFMRLLDDAILRLGDLDEPGNLLAANSLRIAEQLIAGGLPPDEARRLSRYRIFSNAPGTYRSGVSDVTLDSTSWEDETVPAEVFLNGSQYAYGAQAWGVAPDSVNLFAEQLRGSDAVIMSRSSNLHGVLGSDHPFEFLGGLALAIRHLDGESPGLFISDLRRGSPRTTTVASFLSDELRLRYLSPQWITAMQEEGYAGTLSALEGVNNLFGWQVTAPDSVRDDQWQALFDTYVNDSQGLELEAWFETHNPSAQAQLIARMAEAVRKNYWQANNATRRRMAERWVELAANPDVRAGEAEATRMFLEDMAAGFGLSAAPAATLTPPTVAAAETMSQPDRSTPSQTKAENTPARDPQTTPKQVRGPVLEPVLPADQVEGMPNIRALLGGLALLALIVLGAALQIRANRITGRHSA